MPHRRSTSLRAPARGRPAQAHSDHALEAMAWIQQLYEGGVLPVREIAQLAGVTERMIYKYVQAGGWQRRRGALAFDTSPAATHHAAKACVSAARKARAASEEARAQAEAKVAPIAAKREREARFDVLDALCEALFEMAKWVAETNGNVKLRERAEPLQHRVMDAIERMQWSFSSLPGLTRQSRSETQCLPKRDGRDEARP